MSGKQQSGWVYMCAGLAIGLFVAFIVYLDSRPSPAKRAPQNRIDIPEPKFDFYKILPGIEVVVPELEVLPKRDQAAEVVPRPPAPTPALEAGEKFVLQVGSFQEFKQADKLKASLALLGVEAKIQKVIVDKKTWYRVRIGPYHDPKTLNAMRQTLKANNVNAITLKYIE